MMRDLSEALKSIAAAAEDSEINKKVSLTYFQSISYQGQALDDMASALRYLTNHMLPINE